MRRTAGGARPALLAGVAVLLLTVLLAACGSDDSSSPTGVTLTTTAAATPGAGAGKLPSVGSSPDFDPQAFVAALFA